jgi:hypothetical protein
VACHVTTLRYLDTRVRSILNLPVRALLVLLVVLASATALAKPRVQVATFTVHGDALGYFGPEVARAVTAALEGDGVETGAGAAETITGHVEELSGERVQLSATLRGRTLTAEGPLEAIDAVATQLANKIAPLLLENDPAAQKLAEKRAHDAERRAASVPPSRPAPKPRPGPKSEPAVVEEPKSESKPVVAEEPAAESKPVEAKSESKGENKNEPKSEPKSDVKTPDWSPPRVDSPPPKSEALPVPAPAPPVAPPTPSPYFGGFVRGRVVAHAVADLRQGYPSAGPMATQALFSFLQRRLRLSVIPTGVGITSANVAADEAYRAAARAVVMARLEAVELAPGPTARVRLEVVVVRDGRPVMRRVVESAPSDPSRRGPGADPVYQGVTMALEALVPELVGALADVR